MGLRIMMWGCLLGLKLLASPLRFYVNNIFPLVCKSDCHQNPRLRMEEKVFALCYFSHTACTRDFV